MRNHLLSHAEEARALRFNRNEQHYLVERGMASAVLASTIQYLNGPVITPEKIDVHPQR
jgi:hypothetical protein